MSRFTPLAVAVTVTLALAAPAPPVIDGPEADPPPIKEIMGTLNKGPKSLTATIGRSLEENKPAWSVLADRIGDYGELVEALGENVPPRGEPASWTRLTTEYRDEVEVLALAIEEHDREAALASHAKIRRFCTGCHLKHKP